MFSRDCLYSLLRQQQMLLNFSANWLDDGSLQEHLIDTYDIFQGSSVGEHL